MLKRKSRDKKLAAALLYGIREAAREMTVADETKAVLLQGFAALQSLEDSKVDYRLTKDRETRLLDVISSNVCDIEIDDKLLKPTVRGLGQIFNRAATPEGAHALMRDVARRAAKQGLIPTV